MDEIQRISGEICDIFQNKIDSLTDEQAEYLNLCNKSMEYYVEVKDKDKALWNARHTLEYLLNITKDF